MSEEIKKKKPLVLVISSHDNQENWYDLLSPYSKYFDVEQTGWDRMGFFSISTDSSPIITLAPATTPMNFIQKTTRYNIQPSLVLVRNLARSIGSRLGITPDYRNILYGFAHANVPLLNDIDTLIAELEKPIMYGRLKSVQDKYGKENFPLIEQYYYPEFAEIHITPPAPFVLKVGYPHAGYGKIRVHDHNEAQDLASIIALNNTYSSAEPLIESEYELRIVFMAPNYYRVHKRMSGNWKVNFGMSNIREECEMQPRWKRWCDMIYKEFPNMVIFDIDALVDKQGKEYILEVNGSTQGFCPEHGEQDLKHMTELVVRKMESIMGVDILPDGDIKKLFRENVADVKVEDDEKETKIVNLKNKVDDLERYNEQYVNKVSRLENRIKELKKDHPKNSRKFGFDAAVGILFGVLVYFILSFVCKVRK